MCSELLLRKERPTFWGDVGGGDGDGVQARELGQVFEVFVSQPALRAHSDALQL